MQHAVAVEPVVFRARIELRIGTRTQKHAVQSFRELSDHLEVLGKHLVVHRSEVAAQVGVAVGKGRGGIGKGHGRLL